MAGSKRIILTTKQSSIDEEKLDFKKVLPIFIIILVDLLGLTIIIPLLPIYAASFGADPIMIGLLGTAYPLMQFIGAPLLGGLSDRFGRKPILLISQVGTFLGFLVLGFANTIIWIFVARIIDGISGANIAVAQAALTDSTTEKTRAQGLGLLGAAFGIGFIIGPIIAFVSLALSHNNYHIPAFVAAGFSLFSIMLTTFWFKETLPKEQQGVSEKQKNTFVNIFQLLGKPFIGPLLILMFCQQFIFGAFEYLIPLFTLNRLGINASGNTIVFVFVGIIIVLVQGKYIGPWSRKYGERKLIYAGLILVAIGLVCSAITPAQTLPGYSRVEMIRELSQNTNNTTNEELSITIPQDGDNGWLGIAWILVAMIPTAIGGGLLSPSINSLLTKNAGNDIGGLLGVSAALVSAANALNPVIGGAVFKLLGSTAPFLIGGIFMGVLYFVANRTIINNPPPIETRPLST